MPALEVDPEEPGQGMAPSRSILAGTYNQTYLIRTPDAGEDAREAAVGGDGRDVGCEGRRGQVGALELGEGAGPVPVLIALGERARSRGPAGGRPT